MKNHPTRPASDMVDTLDAAAQKRLAAVTTGWDATNRRRGELIHRDIQDGLSLPDTVELERLQQLADLHIALVMPLDFTKLVETEWQIHRERVGSTWACPYCSVTTRDKSTAVLHPEMCEKWPYRLLADAAIEMVRANDALSAILVVEADRRLSITPIPKGSKADAAIDRCRAADKAMSALAREAADAAIERENTEGES